MSGEEDQLITVDYEDAVFDEPGPLAGEKEQADGSCNCATQLSNKLMGGEDQRALFFCVFCVSILIIGGIILGTETSGYYFYSYGSSSYWYYW